MKRELTKAIALAAISSSIAFCAHAADLYPSPKAGGAICDPICGWPGFYFGINGGYGWGEASSLTASSFQEGDEAAVEQTVKFLANGGLGGGQIGYNLGRDRLILGLEADIQAASIAGDAHVQAVNSSFLGIGYVRTDAWAKTNLDWFGTLRARAGYTIGNTLIFATGGFAFGGARDSLRQSVYSADPADPVTVSDAVSKNATLTGYAIGGGFETPLSSSWSIKAEYLRIDLGSTTLSTNNDIIYDDGFCTEPQCTDNGHASAKLSHAYNTVRLGLNYKIGHACEPMK